MKMSIGVDLHKTQFTVCILSEDRRVNESGLYPTSEYGYDAFLRKMTGLMDQGYEITAAVESTGNTRYFRNQLLKEGIGVKVVNTMKFKVGPNRSKRRISVTPGHLRSFLKRTCCLNQYYAVRRAKKSAGLSSLVPY